MAVRGVCALLAMSQSQQAHRLQLSVRTTKLHPSLVVCALLATVTAHCLQLSVRTAKLHPSLVPNPERPTDTALHTTLRDECFRPAGARRQIWQGHFHQSEITKGGVHVRARLCPPISRRLKRHFLFYWRSFGYQVRYSIQIP